MDYSRSYSLSNIKKVGDVLNINPGSRGQLPNRIQGANWAMLDTILEKVELQ